MNNNLEKTLGISIIVVLIFGTIIIYSTQQTFNEFQFKREIKVDSKKLFDVLADVQNYPKVFPKTISSVKVLNQTNDTILTEETISYQGITRVIEIKHEIIPYKSHTITALSGEFKNTSFIIKFEEKQNLVIVNAELYFPAYLELYTSDIPIQYNKFLNSLYGDLEMAVRRG